MNLYLTDLLSWVLAATVTWFLNRVWTFSGRIHGPFLRQWVQFLGANSFGLVLYYATYATAITLIHMVRSEPYLRCGGGFVHRAHRQFHVVSAFRL